MKKKLFLTIYFLIAFCKTGCPWKSLLHREIRHKRFQGVKQLLEINTSEIKKYSSKSEYVNERDQIGATPLYWACVKGSFAMAELLITHGAYVNAPNKDGVTPLHIACRLGRIDIAKLLLKYGAEKSVNLYDNYERTPLYCGVCKFPLSPSSFGATSFNIATLLIANGAKVSDEDVEVSIGKTKCFLQEIYRTQNERPKKRKKRTLYQNPSDTDDDEDKENDENSKTKKRKREPEKPHSYQPQTKRRKLKHKPLAWIKIRRISI